MKLSAWILGALAAAVIGTAAHAFQETQVGGPEAARPKAGVEQGKPSDKALDLTVSQNKIAGKGTTGIEVRVPGLGKLGVLPKLDFGLELLYGAAEPEETVPGRTPQDDVTIRGSIKHRF
jgi:hypothetical protein